MAMWRSLLLLMLLPAAALAQSISTIEPRAFGWTAGDVVQRRLLIEAPAGMALDLASLPQARKPVQAIELRRARLQGRELLLEYQVFLAPTTLRTLEIAPMKLRFAGPAGERFVRVEAWPLTVAPLTPDEVSPREGLGELRPDLAPPLLDLSARRTRLVACAAALLLLGAVATWRWFGIPWLGRRRRPFALAWRLLRKLPARPSPDQRQAALKALHGALNQSAGQVLFEAGLPRFVAARPGFAPLQDELQRFFRQSHDEFFAGRAGEFDAAGLRRLARRCRDAERNGA